MLDTLRHLLPDSIAWRLVVERTLKKYLRGVATIGSDVVAFIDDVYDDLWPDRTRELTEWLKQFGIEYWAWGNDEVMRDYLAFRWGEDRGQSPKHLQDKLQAAGFDAYVYDSFDMQDVSLSTYASDAMTVGAQDSNLRGFSFGQGGRKLYLAGGFNQKIFQYSLASPYDLSSASYDSVSFTTTTQDNAPFDVRLSTDGTKMFILGGENDSIYEYNLPTPFSLTGASYVDALSVTAKETIPQHFHWKPDGTEVYVIGSASDTVHRYTLGTAWDVSTGTFTQTLGATITDPTGVTFNEAGTVMMTLGLSSNLIYQWKLSTAWDLSTAVLSTSLSVASQDNEAISIRYENGHLFMGGRQNDDIYRYRFGAWRDPLTYAVQPKRGNTQCGDDGSGINPVAECGEQPPDQDTLDSATCNALLANEVWYLVNRSLTGVAPPAIPTDNSKWGPFWYVSGSPIATQLEIDLADRDRFEKLCLKHGPAEDWIVTNIELWESFYISEWGYRGAEGNPATVGQFGFSPGFVSPLSFSDLDDAGVDQQTALGAFTSGDTVRLFRTDDGSWIEYVTTGPSVEFTGYWTVPINTTAVAQSSNWAGFPGLTELMKVYRRESV